MSAIRISQPPERVTTPTISTPPTEPTCACSNTAIRVMTYSDGRKQFTKQCLTCGKNLGAVKKTIVRVPQMVEPFDEALRERWQQKCRAYWDARAEYNRQTYDANRAQQNKEWWDDYDRYLLTPEWRDKRNQVLERDKEVCQGCFQRKAITAHHLSYEHVRCEFLFELISVCAVCHARLHPHHQKGFQR